MLYATIMTLASLTLTVGPGSSTWDGGAGNWSDAMWNGSNSHIPGGNTLIDDGNAVRSTVTLDQDAVVSDLTVDLGDVLDGGSGSFQLDIRGASTATINGTLRAGAAGQSLTIRREDGNTNAVSLVNNSPLEAINGGTLLITRGGAFASGSFSVTNNGLVRALNGSRFKLADNVNLTNLVANTLTGGIWLVDDQGGPTTIHFGGGGSSIATNAAGITLSGPNAAWQNLDALAQNNGSFSILSGHNFDAALLTNTGAVVIGAGSTLSTTQGGYTQTGGSTIVNGTLSAGLIDIQGGTLSGVGNIEGNIEGNLAITGGTVNPGASPGVLNITGDFTQDSSSSTTFELGGLTPGNGAGFHDQINLTGNADIDGVINIVLLGGFAPPHGTHEFDLILANGIGGTPTLNFPFTPGASYSTAVISGGGGDIFRLTTVNTPEPATLTMLIIGSAVMLRRKRRQ